MSIEEWLEEQGRLPSLPTTDPPDVPNNIEERRYNLSRFGVPPATQPTAPTAPDIEERRYNLPQYGTPPAPSAPSVGDLSMQARIEARGGYTLCATPGAFDPLQQQYMDLYGVPYNPYTGPGDPFDESRDAQVIAQERYFAEEIDPVTRQFSQFIGDEYYSGGSEQATLGVFNQQLANLGMLSSEELGFLGLTPTDQMSWILSPADVRRLTSSDPALSTYANDLRINYGDDWFEQLYEVDEETGWAQLIGYGEDDSYDGGGWGGYAGGGYRGGGGGGYGSTYQAAARWGLVNWRIG